MAAMMRGGGAQRPQVDDRCGRSSGSGVILPVRLPVVRHQRYNSGCPQGARTGRQPLRRRNRARITRASLTAPSTRRRPHREGKVNMLMC